MNTRLPIQRRPSHQLLIRRLEDRLTPALTTTFDAVSGLLTVTSDAADTIVLGDLNRDGITDLNGAPIPTATGDGLRVAEVSQVVVNGGPGPNNIDLSDCRVKFKEANRLSFKKGGLSTVLSGPNSPDDFGLPIRVNGGAGDDTITGSLFEDDLDGGTGNDQLFGGPGSDVLRCELNDLVIDGQGGTNGCILSLNGLPPGTPVLKCTVDTDTQDVKVEYSGLPTPTSLHGVPFVHFEGGDFAFTGGPGVVNLRATTSGPPPYLKYELEEVFITSFSVTAGGGGGGGTSGQERPTESLSFNFSKVEVKYVMQGSGADDRFVVTPGRSEVTIDGGAGNDAVFINHGGYPYAQTASDITVATKAPIVQSNVEVQEFGRIFRDDAALEALRLQGVTASASIV